MKRDLKKQPIRKKGNQSRQVIAIKTSGTNQHKVVAIKTTRSNQDDSNQDKW